MFYLADTEKISSMFAYLLEGPHYRCSHLLHRITNEAHSLVGRLPGH